MRDKNTHFQFKHFRINQAGAAMKVSTEACILGGYCEQAKPQNILDIGTGTGLLALMLNQKYPQASVTALEIEKNAFLQAQENVNQNLLAGKINVLHQSVQDFSLSSQEAFDLIVCNPPFYRKHLLSVNKYRNLALHQESLSLEELAECIKILLASKGLAFVLLPPKPMQQFILLCKEKTLFPQKVLEIYHSPQHQLFRYVVAFGFAQIEANLEKLYIKNTDATYTEPFQKLLKDFYLAF
ncbi:MAG: methyltransferase [Raineya sp.]